MLNVEKFLLRIKKKLDMMFWRQKKEMKKNQKKQNSIEYKLHLILYKFLVVVLLNL